jgi:hypothetical protein
MSRLQTLNAKGLSPDLPSPGAAAHLVDYLFELGPVTAGAAGPAPIGWPDLQAWQQSTGVELQAWESRGLRRLSYEYLDASQAAQAPDCPAPYSRAPTPDHRARVARDMRAIFNARKNH